MGAPHNGLTLEGLAQKLETQTQRLEALEHENTELRDKVTALRGSDTRWDEVAALRGSGTDRSREPASEFAGPVSRASLLSKAGAAAVAAVAAGTLLYPREAKAEHWDDPILVNRVWTHRVTSLAEFRHYAIRGENTSGGRAAVEGSNTGSGPGVLGVNGEEDVNLGFEEGAGVRGAGQTGVWGSSSATGFQGVFGENTGQGYGVVGNGRGESNAGVLGNNAGGHGVRGEGKTGVYGKSPATGFSGVSGEHTGTSGYGVVGDGKGSSAGVLGRNPNGVGGAGVVGEARSGGVVGRATIDGGIGVEGTSQKGYGGKFWGDKGNLVLGLHVGSGPPTTDLHAAGALYMDINANLFVCTERGTPGTWRMFRTVAV